MKLELILVEENNNFFFKNRDHIKISVTLISNSFRYNAGS